jgi:hypothetical protein
MKPLFIAADLPPDALKFGKVLVYFPYFSRKHGMLTVSLFASSQLLLRACLAVADAAPTQSTTISDA